jgi:raffinose/stachyose/melibiose transport system substrate-binding protein
MKKNFFKKMISMLTLVSLLAAAAGCGKSDTEEPSGGNQAAPTETGENQETVVLKMLEHSNEATNNAIKALNDKFMEKYPNIKIESTTVEAQQYPQVLQTRLAAGDVDLIEFTCFNISNPDFTKGLDKTASMQYIENGDILDITDQPFVQNWDEATNRDANSYDGKVYSLNIGKVAYNGVFYNKAIFRDNGLTVPETWEEFVQLCETLQSKGISPITSGGKDGWPIAMGWPGFVNANETDVMAFEEGLWTGERKYNDAETLKLFDKMATFASFYEKGVNGVDYASVIGRFVAGKAAMLQDGTWQAAQITAADPDFEFGYFCIPGDTKGSLAAQLAGKYDIGYAGAAKSANTEAVIKWLEFFSDKDNYTDFINAIGFIPTMQGITVDNAFINEIAPLNQDFQINYEIIHRAPKGVGKYAGFAINELKVLGGSIETTQELADLAQKDQEDALNALE